MIFTEHDLKELAYGKRNNAILSHASFQILMLGNIPYLTQPAYHLMPCPIKRAEVLKLEKVMKYNLLLCNTARRKVIVASSAPYGNNCKTENVSDEI